MSTILPTRSGGPEIAPEATPDSPTLTPEANRTRRRLAQAVAFLTPPALVAIAAVGLWYLLTYLVLTGSQRLLLPPAHEVVRDGLLTWKFLSVILGGLWSTTQVTLFGLGLAIVLGTGLATLMSQARWLERTIFPYAVMVQAVPIVAIVPLLSLWFGRNYASRVVVTVIISLFPIITNTLFGLRSVDRSQHDLFTLHGAGRWTRLRKLQFPSAMPAIFTGLRIAAGLAVIGAIVGDFFFRQGNPGIGRLLSTYQLRLQADQMIVAIFFSSLLGLALFTFVGSAGHRATRTWHQSTRSPVGGEDPLDRKKGPRQNSADQRRITGR
ncbi:MAG: ABC transporter permease [Acidimicrobiia bacterium]